MCSRIVALFCFILMCGCSMSDEGSGISVFSASFDFNESQAGWEADFTDLPPTDEDSVFYELKFAYTNLPGNLSSRKGIMLSGNNHSDDLFMFIKRKVAGLAPNTYYTLLFEVELASNAPYGTPGAGGSPGESVYLKAGGSEVEPTKTIQNNKYVLNVDKGNQSSAGANAIVLGNIATAEASADYAIISRNNASYGTAYSDPFVVQSNDKGEIWLFVGTDSGFEGITTVYYTKVNVLFSAPY